MSLSRKNFTVVFAETLITFQLFNQNRGYTFCCKRMLQTGGRYL